MSIRLAGGFAGFSVTGDLTTTLRPDTDWPFEIVTDTGTRINGIQRVMTDNEYRLKLVDEGAGARILDFNKTEPVIEIDGDVRSIVLRSLDLDAPPAISEQARLV